MAIVMMIIPESKGVMKEQMLREVRMQMQEITRERKRERERESL